MSKLILGIVIGIWIGFALGIIMTSLLSFNREIDKEEARMYGEIKIKNNN